MRPLILEYAEEPHLQDNDFANALVYSEDLNLTVLRDSGEPAITLPRLATETFTKTIQEDSDTDRNLRMDHASAYMGTETETRTHTEVSDSDVHHRSLLNYLGTMTLTLTHESSDTD